MIREYLKQKYKNTKLGQLLFTPIVRSYQNFGPRLLPEKLYAKQTFKNVFLFNLDLSNPKTLNEKIIWLRLIERTKIKTICADKYAVRKFVDSKIGAKYLVPLVFQTHNPKEIVPEKLPNYPIIIKTNHGCGGHIIVKDKSEIDWVKIRKIFAKSLRDNFYFKSKEWQYKNIKPRILIEKLLLEEGYPPQDFKLNCFNGKVHSIEVHYDRHIQYKKNIYYPNWEEIDCRWGAPKGRDLDKPKNLDKMIQVAERLADEFKYVRVDLYNVKTKIYFGELTFSPAGGFCPFIPHRWDRIFGDQLII